MPMSPGSFGRHRTHHGRHRDLRQRPVGVLLQQRIVGPAPRAADDHRQTLELWVAQQLDRGVEGVHVEVGDTTRQR